ARGQQPRRVVRDDRDALARRDAERVEARGLSAREARNLRPRELAERLGRLVRFVDDTDAIAIHELGALDEIAHGQRYTHGRPLWSGELSLVGRVRVCSTACHAAVAPAPRR